MFMVSGPGDSWYFPLGIPHSLQATNETVNGVESLLVSLDLVANQACANPHPKVFHDGDFSEDATFLVSYRGTNHLLPC